jgi:SPP1 family predicted phage head-tail adaptor
MRTGNLDRTIKIQSYNRTGISDAGTETFEWQDTGTFRAELVQASTADYLRSYGEGATTSAIFRMHFRQGITTDHRLVFAGVNYNIREVKEIGRRQGLELRCEVPR